MHTFEKTKLESFRENNMARILILLGLLTDIFSFFCSQNLKNTFFINQSTVLCLGLLFSPWWSRWVIDIFDIHAFVTKNGIAGAILLKSTYLLPCHTFILSIAISHWRCWKKKYLLTSYQGYVRLPWHLFLCTILITLHFDSDYLAI